MTRAKAASLALAVCAALLELFAQAEDPKASFGTARAVRVDFSADKAYESASASKYPADWDYKGTWRVPDAKMYVVKDAELGTNVLKMNSNKEGGTLLYYKLIGKLDLKKTPIMRWNWKATKLPKGGDGRDMEKDDQAIGLYVGFGRFLRKSVSYRWETDTPIGAEGNANYARVVSVRWHCLRNKDSEDLGKWKVEERNIAEDFKKDFGEIPPDVVLSVSINSQYTGTEAEAFLEYIEFVSESEAKASKP